MTIDWVRGLKFCMKAWFHSLWGLWISDFGLCPCKGQGRHRTHSNSTRCHICYIGLFNGVASLALTLIGSKLPNLSLLVFIMNKCKARCKNVSVLAQYLGLMTNFSIFDSKLRLTKHVQSLIFQKFCRDIEKLIFLEGTKVFTLKSHERITHLLHCYRSDKQFVGGIASEALA